MELAFRKDVVAVNGVVKYPAGVFFDWPKQTFLQVAKNLGKPLEKLTMTKEEAARNFVEVSAEPIVGSRKKTPQVASAKRRRPRTHLPTSMQV